ncbi:MAG: protein-L-isoaspartate(D-aspartate) O-methyltransferase [Candidatus Delongbacteria bacterium]|nr:protein-L-isoaspartate(D-aspartate) O-methyltransferase [Candidatus Delongbacteria bacterium]MCG2760862.1 protein-L-isoaspartate(D-aspartate) O-methyltransferase [Candidatus Delongbacteria bacterium]
MINFEFAKKEMIEIQLKRRGILDNRVLSAFESIPRHLFVPEGRIENSYDDSALPIGFEQTISQPYIVALMTQLLRPLENDIILEIGTGSGYQAAILSKLCKFVVSLERKSELVSFARDNISKLEIKNVQIYVGDGTLGWKSNSPYDGIIVTAGAKEIPSALISQLKPGGKMIIPLEHKGYHKLTVVKKEENSFVKEEIIDCIFVPLIGRG